MIKKRYEEYNGKGHRERSETTDLLQTILEWWGASQNMFEMVTPDEPGKDGQGLWNRGFHALHLITVEPKEATCLGHLEFLQILSHARIWFKKNGEEIWQPVQDGRGYKRDTPLKAPVVDIDWVPAAKAQRDQLFLPVTGGEFTQWSWSLHFTILVRKVKEDGKKPGPILYVKHWYVRAESHLFKGHKQLRTPFNIFSQRKGTSRHNPGDISGMWHDIWWGLSRGSGGWRMPNWTTPRQLLGYDPKELQAGPVSGESAKKLAEWARAAGD